MYACKVTFEWDKAHINNLASISVSHDATSTGCPEQHTRNPQFFRHTEREAHDAVGDNAGHRRYAGLCSVIEARDKVSKGSQEVGFDGVGKGGGVLGGVLVVRGRKAIGYGGEAEVGEAVEGRGASGSEEATVVEVGVDECDVEATVVEEFGYFEHGVHVALCRYWHHNGMWLSWFVVIYFSRHGSTAVEYLNG